MSRGRRQSNTVAPAPSTAAAGSAATRWWGDAPSHVAEAFAGGSDPRHREDAAAGMLANTVWGALGERDFEGARELVEAWRASSPDTEVEPLDAITDADLEQQARIVNAMKELGLPVRREVLTRFGRMDDDPLRQLIIDRLEGDEGERRAAVLMKERRRPASLFSSDLTTWQAAVRAVRRVPERYRSTLDRSAGEEIRIATDEGTAHEVMTRARAAGWAVGTRILLERGPENRRRAHFCLRAMGTVEGRPLALSAVVYTGTTKATTASGLRRVVAGQLRQLGWPSGAAPFVEPDWSGAALAGFGAFGDPPVRLPVIGALSGLAGYDSCRHQNGIWNGEARGALTLGCPDCLRERIAVVPAHRLPETHTVAQLAARQESDYMAAERARAALEGRELTAQTIAELRAGERLAPLDPTAYAQPLPPNPQRAMSLRQAMRRR